LKKDKRGLVLTAFAGVVDPQVLLALAGGHPQHALVDVRLAVRAANRLQLVLRTVLRTPAARLPAAVHVATRAERAEPLLAHFCNKHTHANLKSPIWARFKILFLFQTLQIIKFKLESSFSCRGQSNFESEINSSSTFGSKNLVRQQKIKYSVQGSLT